MSSQRPLYYCPACNVTIWRSVDGLLHITPTQQWLVLTPCRRCQRELRDCTRVAWPHRPRRKHTMSTPEKPDLGPLVHQLGKALRNLVPDMLLFPVDEQTVRQVRDALDAYDAWAQSRET